MSSRAVYVFLGVVVLFILFLAFVVGYLASTARGERALAEPPPPSPYDERMLEIEREAVDDAFRNQLTLLFGNWMKDDHDQPRRMLVGVNQARRAYVATVAEIEKRQKKLQKP